MARSIIAVGFEIPGDQAKYASLHSKLSLLDYDIAVFNPVIREFHLYSEEYLGKPCLSDTNSFQLREHLEHWRREILEAIRAGKTVFLLLNTLQEVYIATGEKTYSGTGRNRQTTRHVTIHKNYALVPGIIEIVNTNGESMQLSGRDNLLDAYWSEMSAMSEYRVLVSGDGVRPLVKTKTGNKIVGAYLRYKNASGILILLPFVNFEREGFAEYKEESMCWSEVAIQAGLKFKSALVAIDKTVHESNDISPPPGWAESARYALPKEREIREELLKLETKAESIQKRKEEKQQRLLEEIALKRLLYEKGKPLEAAIKDALQIMGFDVSEFNNGESEFDVVFESAEGRLIGEAEGKDNKPINIDKLRQLEMNIHEDFERDEVSQEAKGALIGNAYRYTKPDERGDFFTEKCLTAAERSKTALIRSVDLFTVVKYLTGTNDKEFAKQCREAILQTTGVVRFPSIPETVDNANDEKGTCK
jgi:hypothetical protein